MTTKLNATTSGLVESVDTSGVLELQTGNVSALVIGTDQNANFTGTTAITVPNGTTAQRPTPVNGMMRYNTTLSIFEVYANNSWSAANVTPTPVNTVAPVISGSAIVGQNLTCTTGTWSGSPSAYYYQWRANSTAISNATANVITLTLAENGANITCNVTAYNVAGNSTPATSNSLGPVINGTTANFLVVGGGGGGGGAAGASSTGGGGGGAGGYRTSAGTSGGGNSAESTIILTPSTTYTVIVGSGGAGGLANTIGTNGSNSSISTITSIGGGGGAKGYTANTGAAGGSGGGGGYQGYGGAGTSGQGYAGGGIGGTDTTSSGGGGAGQAGFNGVPRSGLPGNGGNGVSSTISGTATYYAGGGGGGTLDSDSSAGGTGGLGGGGNGASTTYIYGIPGAANTGGGGGGGARIGSTGYAGSSGGSGIVIISYAGAQQFGGGVISTDGSNTIHTFYTSGSLVPLTALSANYLIVGGGGGGGTVSGGGGGGGGVLSGSNVTIDSNSTYVITVGAGGSGTSDRNANATSGANSTFFSGTAIGGGGGGSGGSSSTTAAADGRNGGSGGGASYEFVGSIGAGNPGAGTAGQGYAGGAGNSAYPGSALGEGGGGGAGQAGFAGSGSTGGQGGNGAVYSISGTATYYGGGGGGGNGAGGTGGSAGAGGLGGGGAGGNYTGTVTGTNGTANLGGGGGGAGYDSVDRLGGNGGSGIVYISYPGSTPMMAGGNVTVVSNTVVHTFTSSGYLTPFVNFNNSLRFRGSANAYLSRTPTTLPTSSQKFTISFWAKMSLKTTSNGEAWLLDCYNQSFGMYFNSNSKVPLQLSTGAGYYVPSQVTRDPAAWYHFVVAVDTTQATGSNRIHYYVNGTEVSSWSTQNIPSQNTTYNWNANGNAQYIGTNSNDTTRSFDGNLAEFYSIDGQQLSPYAFGTFNQYGVWAPVAYSGSYGNNGFHLNFGNTANTTALGYDSSGNGNNWTPTNISLTAGATYDSMVDVPTLTSANVANYAVLNPLEALGYGPTAGNLNITSSSGVYAQTRSTIYFDVTTTTGFYAEFTVNGSLQDDAVIGIMDNSALSTGTLNAGSYNLVARGSGGGYTWWTANSGGYVSNTTVAEASGQVIGVAVKNGKLYFAINNTWVLSGNPTTESNPAFTGLTGLMAFLVKTWQSNALSANFGQRPFAYTPPTGYLPLNTYNM